MMKTVLISGSMASVLLTAALSIGAAAPPIAPTPELPPFLPVKPYEPPVPTWARVNPRSHYRQRRPGRRF